MLNLLSMMIRFLAKKLNADGCHLGQNDVDIKIAKKNN